jgi:hypothetical protein
LLTLFKSLALKRKATLLKMTIKNTFKDAKNEFDIVSLRGFSFTQTELTNLRIFEEKMEKTMQNEHVVWVKTYRLSDSGKWFAMLLAEEKDLSKKEKAEILQNIFRTYIKSLKELSEKLNVKEETLKEIFEEEMKYKGKKR